MRNDDAYFSIVHCAQDGDSDYLTPRSTFNLPDVPELAAALTSTPSVLRSISIPKEVEVASRSSSMSKKRVFIPELPVTPFGEPRCACPPTLALQIEWETD